MTKYYVVDDITGMPELAEVIAEKEDRVLLRSVMNPAIQYNRSLDEIYATREEAAYHCAPAFMMPAYEYLYESEYGTDYVGPCVAF